jgi:5-methylcytosine-specific restriction endonuclease McrA
MANEFDHQTLSFIWAKARIVAGYDQNVYRMDAYGSIIAWASYGKRDSRHGWEVDHIVPLAKGGSSLITNLRPLQWQNNARKSDNLV